MPRTRSDGWTVTVDHPATGRTIHADVLDDPQAIPSLLGPPRIRIRVRADRRWLELPTPPTVDDYPAMAITKDGDELPIDELRRVDDARFEQGVVILEGRGGPALDDRTQASFDTIRRHEAARQLIQNSPYQADVDDPETTTRTGQLMQLLETTTEFDGALDRDATTPLFAENDTVGVERTSFTSDVDGPLFWDRSGTTFATNQDGYNAGTYDEFDTVGDYLEFRFTTGYDIPEYEFSVDCRAETILASDSVEFTTYLDGSEINTTSIGSDLEWRFFARVAGPESDAVVPAGEHTFRLELSSLSGDGARISVANFRDRRYTYNFDETLSSTQGYLDGPEDYPPGVIAMFADALSPFAVVAGEASIDIDDTSNNQYVGISNDRGDTWTDASNATSVSTTFADDGPGLRARVNLSRYSPNGARGQTPRFGYDAQTLSRLETRADIEEVLLLLNEDFDNSLESILNFIAGDTAYVWSYNLDANGDPQISWTQPGQRTAGRDPDLGNVRVTEDVTTYPSVTIKGTPQGVSGERFTASEPFVDLNEAGILSGSEVVYDPSDGTNFERDADYRLDREGGQIRIVGSGGMSSGSTYAIDYRHKIEGTYEVPNAPADPDELVREVPGVTSSRQAEQIAFVIADDVSVPRYTAELQIPRSEGVFDALEALTLENLDIPAEATPLEPRGEPEITPQGLALRLGSRPPVQEILSDVSEQVSRLSERA